MAATVPLKKSPYVKEWMGKANSSKEGSTVKKMNGRSLDLSSNKMTCCFKEWTTTNGVFKKYIFLTKIRCFKEILLTVAVTKNYGGPKEN